MKGWKTLVFGVALALLSIFSNADMQSWVGAHLPIVGGATGVIILILRYITTSPIFKDDPTPPVA